MLTADPVLPGEAHDDSVAQTLGHIPAHPTTLVEKQGIGTASIRGEDGLVGVGLEVGERQMETSMRGLEVPPWCPTPWSPTPLPDTGLSPVPGLDLQSTLL